MRDPLSTSCGGNVLGFGVGVTGDDGPVCPSCIVSCGLLSGSKRRMTASSCTIGTVPTPKVSRDLARFIFSSGVVGDPGR